MKELVNAEHKQTRIAQYRKNMGVYWNGREDEEITEYSGYLLTHTKSSTPQEKKYFVTKDKAEEGFLELKRTIKKYKGYIMPVWFFYSSTLGMLSHRQRDI